MLLNDCATKRTSVKPGDGRINGCAAKRTSQELAKTCLMTPVPHRSKSVSFTC